MRGTFLLAVAQFAVQSAFQSAVAAPVSQQS